MNFPREPKKLEISPGCVLGFVLVVILFLAFLFMLSAMKPQSLMLDDDDIPMDEPAEPVDPDAAPKAEAKPQPLPQHLQALIARAVEEQAKEQPKCPR